MFCVVFSQLRSRISRCAIQRWLGTADGLEKWIINLFATAINTLLCAAKRLLGGMIRKRKTIIRRINIIGAKWMDFAMAMVRIELLQDHHIICIS